MPPTSRDACRRDQRQGSSSCCLHPWFLAGADVGEASTDAACTRIFQELPAPKYQHMPLASIASGRHTLRRSFDACCLHRVVLPCRSYRRRGISACRLHILFLGDGADNEVAVHTACIEWCLQELPVPRYQRMQVLPAGRLRHMPLASSGAYRRYRRRGISQGCAAGRGNVGNRHQWDSAGRADADARHRGEAAGRGNDVIKHQ